METVPYMVDTIYSVWSGAVKTKVGKNLSMENSEIVNKLPYASCYFMGFPTSASDLEGDECAVTPTVQIDVYANGQKGVTEVYEIDEVSHRAMVGMGFRRTFGPELIKNLQNNNIKRLTSRYSRVIGSGDKIQ